MQSARTLLVAGICLFAPLAAAYTTGIATAYSGTGEKDATGFNSCGFGKLDSQWEKYYAALPSQVFDRSSDCGRCIRARGTDKHAPGDWVTVMIVDECASCSGNGDVDFSEAAFEAVTGYKWDMKPIEWEWADCNTGEPASGRSAFDSASLKSGNGRKHKHHKHNRNGRRMAQA